MRGASSSKSAGAPMTGLMTPRCGADKAGVDADEDEDNASLADGVVVDGAARGDSAATSAGGDGASRNADAASCDTDGAPSGDDGAGFFRTLISSGAGRRDG